MPITPYLFFGGRAQEALDYYQKAIGAEVSGVMKYSDMPAQEPSEDSDMQFPAGWENKIMHAAMNVGGSQIYISDGSRDQYNFDSLSLAMEIPDEESARRIFDALAADGKVVMPLAPSFFSPLFGMVDDKFGLGWMVMLPGEHA